MSQATTPAAARSNRAKPMLRPVAHVALLSLAGLAAACTASEEQVRPHEDELFFPTGVAVSPDGSTLFALSANSELRFDSGTIGVIPLDEVDDVVTNWVAQGTVPRHCVADPSFSETLNCDESRFLTPGAGVRIGNFATSIAIQDKGDGDLRLVIPVRGDPSVTWVDWDASAGALTCSDGGGFALCDDAHRLTRFRNDEGLPQIFEEPFGVYVDSGGEYAMVTHLVSGSVTLVDLPIDGQPVLADVLSGVFNSDPVTGVRGSLAVAGRTPGGADNLVYVTSRSESRVQTFSVSRPASGDAPLLVPGSYFFLEWVGSLFGESADTRGAVFGAGGDVGYFMNREPPSLAVVDTSMSAQGVPKNVVVGATDICREASGMALADVGEGERVFISCFQDGELYVVDPRAGADVIAITTVGRGPFGVAVAPSRNRLFVSNFFENTIAVVDLTPGAPTQYRVVLRIGMPPSS